MSGNVTMRTLGLDALRRKLGPQFRALAEPRIKSANEANATEFARRVKAVMRRGDDEGGHLEDTVAVRAKGERAFETSVGDEAHPYPAHLEFGHMAGDTHVPGVPTWFPTLRTFKRRAKARSARALRDTANALKATGGQTPTS